LCGHVFEHGAAASDVVGELRECAPGRISHGAERDVELAARLFSIRGKFDGGCGCGTQRQGEPDCEPLADPGCRFTYVLEPIIELLETLVEIIGGFARLVHLLLEPIEPLHRLRESLFKLPGLCADPYFDRTYF